ncbi:unnamed protein product, partial [Ectocarpus sp. 12 AP-2014]
CADTCADYAYYGTQFGRECWCGNNGDYAAYGEAACDMGCTGDSSETCGGFNAMSPGYLGCFGDSQINRVFPVVTDSNSMTTAGCSDTCSGYAYYGTQFGREECAAFCSAFAYYGTQYGRECWCGNNADYVVYGEASCDMACAGDATDICGGVNAMSV